MRLIAPSILRAATILAAGALAACGSSRTVEGGADFCVRCHGDPSRAATSNALARSAPPRSVSGATATTDVAVGAHQAHLVAGRLRGPIPCAQCHVVPADMQAHEAQIAAIAAGTAQRVAFGPVGPIAATGSWDRATAKCSSTYCHAVPGHVDTTLGNPAPTWTGGAAEAARCTSCHGFPPNTLAHATAGDCHSCHSPTVRADNTIIVDPVTGASTHLDGKVTFGGTGIGAGGCTLCHGAPNGAIALSGAHRAHVVTTATAYGVDSKTSDTLTTAATTYDFGCGNCHPTDLSKHLDGTVEVDLSAASATVGSLKGRNGPAPSYDPVTKTCSGVYCHSSGQATPAFRTSPAWDSTTPIGCNGCHDHPPSYASGGAGTATANGHIGLVNEAGTTYETGHFGGFPAAIHEGSFHGTSATEDSAPITCQACHYATVDATHTGPSGFYYLDTSGSYDLGGTGTFPLGATTVRPYACTNCHGATPPAQGGRAMPWFHVNGTREVAFDPRTSIGGTPTYPSSPLVAPAHPYWFTTSNPNLTTLVNVAGHVDGSAGGYSTVSVDLSSATWNPSTKTCASVACHFNESNRVAIGQPIRWGEPLNQAGMPPPPYTAPAGTCSICHNF